MSEMKVVVAGMANSQRRIALKFDDYNWKSARKMVSQEVADAMLHNSSRFITVVNEKKIIYEITVRSATDYKAL